MIRFYSEKDNETSFPLAQYEPKKHQSVNISYVKSFIYNMLLQTFCFNFLEHFVLSNIIRLQKKFYKINKFKKINL